MLLFFNITTSLNHLLLPVCDLLGPLFGSYLNNGKNVDEIQSLDLVGLQTVRTLHLWKNRNYFLCQRSEGDTNTNICLQVT